MYKLWNDTIDYGSDIDPEIVELLNTLNALPGIETFESCIGHGTSSVKIWFKVVDPNGVGLFILTRCADFRYWKYGDEWDINLSIGDQIINDILPIHYMLHSGDEMGELAYSQMKSLIDNLNDHMNHEGFMKGFNLNDRKYKHMIEI